MPGHPYTPAEMAIVIRAALQGATMAAIAAQLADAGFPGRSIQSVYKQTLAAGIYRRRIPCAPRLAAVRRESSRPPPITEPVTRPARADDMAFQAAMTRAFTALRKVGELP